MKRNYFFWILLLMMQQSIAQSDSAAVKSDASFKIGIFYTSHLNYYGRTDSLRSSGVFPLVEYWFDKHFYVNASPVFINNSISSLSYAGTLATIGFRFKGQSGFGGHLFFVKPFLKEDKQLVQSALKGQLAMSLTHSGKVVNLTAGADIKFSDKTDYGANAGLDHIQRFDLAKSFVLVIDPSFYVYAGTQQFSKTFLKQHGILGLPGFEEQINQPVTKFNILSYEFSAPTILVKGNWQFIFIPSYVVPQNLLEVQDRPDLSERGRAMFYATAGVKVTI